LADPLVEIWNRALESEPRPDARPGDIALANALQVDAVINNGGVLHALGVFDEAEMKAAIDGFTHLGRPDIAAVLRSGMEDAGRVESSPESAERLEAELDERYEAVADEEALEEMLARHHAVHPDDFAPTG
jgi:hypothetical protein